jgi:hypothetical protein
MNANGGLQPVTSEGIDAGPDAAVANLASYPDCAGKIAVVTVG